MSEKEKIINIAVIAHVDAGKSTLVDAFLRQSDVFRSNEEVVDCVMAVSYTHLDVYKRQLPYTVTYIINDNLINVIISK